MLPLAVTGSNPLALETKTGHKLVRSAKAISFDEERLDQYTLLLQFGPRDLQAAAWNEQTGTLEWLEDYALHESSGHSHYVATVGNVVESNPILPAGFWKRIVFGIKSQHFVHVPESIFLPEHAADYLRFNGKVNTMEESILSGPCHYPATKVVFGMSELLHQWLNDHYKLAPKSFVHQSAAIIACAARFGGTGRVLHFFVDRFRMHLLCVTRERLEYYNQFVIRDFADYMRYFGMVVNTLGLDPETCPVILWGYLGAEAPIAEELSKYIRNLRFGNRSIPMRMGHGITGIQDHQFMDVLALPFASKG